jgi:hypothetical protein
MTLVLPFLNVANHSWYNKMYSFILGLCMINSSLGQFSISFIFRVIWLQAITISQSWRNATTIRVF